MDLFMEICWNWPSNSLIHYEFSVTLRNYAGSKNLDWYNVTYSEDNTSKGNMVVQNDKYP
jgi:hypothetical protein